MADVVAGQALGAEPPRSTESALVEAFCTMCQRTTYVRGGSEMTCPVCSSQLFPAD
jgi:hypothetical protein